jgi:hypothetical protein
MRHQSSDEAVADEASADACNESWSNPLELASRWLRT